MHAQRIPDANAPLSEPEVKKKETLDLKTVAECNRCLGSKTLHPQVSLIDLENPHPRQEAVKFEFYAVLLIEDCPDDCRRCGRKYYDYAHASMVFLAPGEIFRLSGQHAFPGRGWLLAFHPDLLFGTSLRNHIGNYTFFSYRKEEALHLSQRETAKVADCLKNIAGELCHAIDTHSGTILSRQIELLLDYCTRFYERQFITRENEHRALIRKTEEMLDEHIASGLPENGNPPPPHSFAGRLHLSTAYFNDLLKFETGLTLAEYFRIKQLEAAKRMLLQTAMTPADVACRLGFPSVQSFSFLFKKITGILPGHYKQTQN